MAHLYEVLKTSLELKMANISGSSKAT